MKYDRQTEGRTYGSYNTKILVYDVVVVVNIEKYTIMTGQFIQTYRHTLIFKININVFLPDCMFVEDNLIQLF